MIFYSYITYFIPVYLKNVCRISEYITKKRFLFSDTALLSFYCLTLVGQ